MLAKFFGLTSEMTEANRDVDGKSQIEDDDVSYEQSVSTDELSVEGAKTHDNTTPPKREILSSVSFYDGMDRFQAHWRVLLAGQALSCFLAISGATASSLFYECNISIPCTQAALVFMFMSFHILNLLKKDKKPSRKSGNHKPKRKFFAYGPKQDDAKVSDEINPSDLALGKSISLDSYDVKKAHNDSALLSPYSLFGVIPINAPIWLYFLFAVISAEAMYASFLALRYTSFMSASLLDNVNIFAAMIASRIILKRRYNWRHILGALICCIGVGLNMFSDFKTNQDSTDIQDDEFAQLNAEEYPNRIVGDVIAIIGGILFGLSDVIAEGVVRNFGGVDEYLGCVGFFGFIITISQAAIFERGAVSKFISTDEITLDSFEDYEDPLDAPRTCSQKNAYVLLIGYAIFGYLFQSGIAAFLTLSESALLTISLLTADLWALLFTVFSQHVLPSALFYVAFVCIIVGVITYEMSPSPLGPAEDLQIHKEIDMEHSHDPFQLSDINMSWDSQKEIV